MTGLLAGIKQRLRRGLGLDLKRIPVMGAIVVLTLVLLAAAAVAAGESVTLGEHQVSFDLGNYTGYELELEEVPYATVDGEEHPSHVCWILANGTMMIALTDHGVPTVATSSLTRRAVTSYLEEANCTTVHTHEERIDGLPAILGLGEQPDGSILFCAVYWPDMHEVNGTLYAQVDCTIASDASVELTESLLNSIHVEFPADEKEEEAGGETAEADGVVV